MAVLSFSLTPEATGRVYEALVCLAKFGESVAIEARGDKVCLENDRVWHVWSY
jgi:cell cycle checkpoint control protein RAD9A